MVGHGILLVLSSISKLEEWEGCGSCGPFPSASASQGLERVIPGMHTEALREVLLTAPGTLPLEMWELRKVTCPIRDESQLFISFNLSSTVLLDNVLIYKGKVYTLSLFLYSLWLSFIGLQ